MRVSGERRKGNTQQMVTFAKAMTDDEIMQAANYFSSLKWTPWVTVRETNTVPKTRSQGGMMIPLTGDQAGTEPIGNRIVEVPVDAVQTETLRNPHSGFIAYVPVGAIDQRQTACGHRRKWQNHRLRNLPRRRSQRPRFGARTRRPPGQL